MLHEFLDAKSLEMFRRGLRTSRYVQKSEGLVRILGSLQSNDYAMIA